MSFTDVSMDGAGVIFAVMVLTFAKSRAQAAYFLLLMLKRGQNAGHPSSDAG